MTDETRETLQIVVEIRQGELPDDTGGLREHTLSTLMLDVAPLEAWAIFRQVVEAATTPRYVIVRGDPEP